MNLPPENSEKATGPYQLLPPLTAEEYAALREDVAAHGIRVPIDVDENGAILDGHHRAQIARELGINPPIRLIAGLDEAAKRDHARAVNALRRQLSIEDRRELVRQMREDGQTFNDIASTLGVSKSLVGQDVAELSRTGKLLQPQQIRGKDGRARPTKYKPRQASQPDETVDALSEPPIDGPTLGAMIGLRLVNSVDEVATVLSTAKRSPKRRPLTDTAADVRADVMKLIGTLQRMQRDDRFGRNREGIAETLAGPLDMLQRIAAEVLGG